MTGITEVLLNNMTYISIMIIISMIVIFAVGVFFNLGLKQDYLKMIKELEGVNNDGMEVYTSRMINEVVSSYKESYLKSYDDINTQAIIEANFYKFEKSKITKETFLKNMTSMLITLGIVGTLYNIIVIVTSLTEIFKKVDVGATTSLTSVLGNVSTIIAYLAIAFVTTFIAITLTFIYSIINSFTNIEMERTNLFSRIEDYLDNILGANLSKKHPKVMNNEIGFANPNVLYMLENTSNSMIATTMQIEKSISSLSDNLKTMIAEKTLNKDSEKIDEIEELPVIVNKAAKKTRPLLETKIGSPNGRNTNTNNTNVDEKNNKGINENKVINSEVNDERKNTNASNIISVTKEAKKENIVEKRIQNENITNESYDPENRINTQFENFTNEEKELEEKERNQKLERVKLLKEAKKVLEAKKNEKLERMKNTDVVPNKDKEYIGNVAYNSVDLSNVTKDINKKDNVLVSNDKQSAGDNTITFTPTLDLVNEVGNMDEEYKKRLMNQYVDNDDAMNETNNDNIIESSQDYNNEQNTYEEDNMMPIDYSFVNNQIEKMNDELDNSLDNNINDNYSNQNYNYSNEENQINNQMNMLDENNYDGDDEQNYNDNYNNYDESNDFSNSNMQSSVIDENFFKPMSQMTPNLAGDLPNDQSLVSNEDIDEQNARLREIYMRNTEDIQLPDEINEARANTQNSNNQPNIVEDLKRKQASNTLTADDVDALKRELIRRQEEEKRIKQLMNNKK